MVVRGTLPSEQHRNPRMIRVLAICPNLSKRRASPETPILAFSLTKSAQRNLFRPNYLRNVFESNGLRIPMRVRQHIKSLLSPLTLHKTSQSHHKIGRKMSYSLKLSRDLLRKYAAWRKVALQA